MDRTLETADALNDRRFSFVSLVCQLKGEGKLKAGLVKERFHKVVKPVALTSSVGPLELRASQARGKAGDRAAAPGQ